MVIANSNESFFAESFIFCYHHIRAYNELKDMLNRNDSFKELFHLTIHFKLSMFLPIDVRGNRISQNIA